MGAIDRLEADSIPDVAAGGWQTLPRPSVHRAAAAYRRDDRTALFVAKDGHAFVFRISTPERVSEDTWKRLIAEVQLMRDSESNDAEGGK